MSDIDASLFRHVLGHFPTGVTAVTAISGGASGGAPSGGSSDGAPAGAPVGMAIGSFTSVSLSPPLVAFLPTKGSTTYEAIAASGAFCVNVMAHDQLDVCAVMASKSEDKFADISWRAGLTGSPIIDGSIAYIDCEIYATYDGGDHDIVVGKVVDLAAPAARDPLLFFKGDYGTFT